MYRLNILLLTFMLGMSFTEFTFATISLTSNTENIIASLTSNIQNTINTENNTISLEIAATTKSPYFTEKNDGFLNLLLAEVGNRLNIKFDILTSMPPERALSKLNQGAIDGDFPRVSGLEKIYPSIIYVPEKIIDFQFVAFSFEQCVSPISFDLMQESKVGLVIGWKIYEERTTNFYDLTTLVKSPQLFNLLSRKRIEYALHEHYIGNKFITDLKLQNKIYECTPPLMIKPMYFYLNKKHRKLVPIISDALKEIKADGTYQLIAEKTLHQIK